MANPPQLSKGRLLNVRKIRNPGAIIIMSLSFYTFTATTTSDFIKHEIQDVKYLKKKKYAYKNDLTFFSQM